MFPCIREDAFSSPGPGAIREGRTAGSAREEPVKRFPVLQHVEREPFSGTQRSFDQHSSTTTMPGVRKNKKV
jgi:hypothetical protein